MELSARRYLVDKTRQTAGPPSGAPFYHNNLLEEYYNKPKKTTLELNVLSHPYCTLLFVRLTRTFPLSAKAASLYNSETPPVVLQKGTTNEARQIYVTLEEKGNWPRNGRGKTYRVEYEFIPSICCACGRKSDSFS